MHQLITRTPLFAARQWSTASQEAACRNAMVASTALAARRHERIEVEGFIRRVLAQRNGSHDDLPVPNEQVRGVS